MVGNTMVLFDNHARYQQHIQNDVAAAREQLTRLREVIDKESEYTKLATHVNYIFDGKLILAQSQQIEEFKVVRQRVQTILQFFTNHVSSLLELNNGVNTLIEEYNIKSNLSVGKLFITFSYIGSTLIQSTNRRKSLDVPSTVNDISVDTSLVPKKKDLLMFDDELEPISNSSTTKSPPSSSSQGSNSPKINVEIFQSPISPQDGYTYDIGRIISPLVNDDTPTSPGSISAATPSITQPPDFQSVEMLPNQEDGDFQTIHDDIATTTIMRSDDDTLTDDILTDEDQLQVPPRLFSDQFESPRPDKIKLSDSTIELDKFLSLDVFGEEAILTTANEAINVEDAMKMLANSPATSINLSSSDSNHDDISTSTSRHSSSNSFELLDELIGIKTNGDIKSGLTTRILSMFEEKPIDMKRSDSRETLSSNPNALKKSPSGGSG